MGLLLFNLDDLEHRNEDACEENASNEWLNSAEDVGTTARAIAAENKEGEQHQDDNDDGKIHDVVNETKVLEIEVENINGSLSVHDIAIAVKLPRDSRPHP